MKNSNLTQSRSGYMSQIMFFILTMTVFSGFTSAQELPVCETSQCKDFSLLACDAQSETAFKSLTISASFLNEFQQNFGCSYTLFESLNPFDISTFKKMIFTDVCNNDINVNQMQSRYFGLINQFQDNLLFQPRVGGRNDVTYIGKDLYIPHEEEPESWFTNGKELPNTPEKATACFNSDFENGDFSTWVTQCGTVNSTLGAILGVTNYTLPAMCNGVVQHSMATGGIDPNTGFPRVFPGGTRSAMIGDGTGSGGRAAIVRKTFTVDPTNSTLIYYYSAVLETPSGHSAGERPFFRARLIRPNGTIDPCAEYFAYGGDGQAGWLSTGSIQYRDWTAVFVPLDAYIGQSVTIEFATGDCSQGGHYGYAYVEAICSKLEIDQVCEGTATVLIAPAGAGTYLWSTGQTTQQITVNSSGNYYCDVTPLGSSCTVRIDVAVNLFPVPVVDISPSESQICIGGEVTLNDNSTVGGGATITNQQWNFGDGISTPSSSGTITGVAQTTGTYAAAEHTYTATGNNTVTLTVITSDGCTASSTEPIIVTPPPTATIATSTTVCQNEASPAITLTGAGTSGPFTFTYNLNGGADQYLTTSSGSSATFNAPTNVAGTFTYNLLHISDPSSPTCAQNQTGSAIITVNPLPTATIGTNATICQNGMEPVITFTGANGSSDFIFTYNINGGANQTISTTGGSNTVTLNAPTAVAGTFAYNLVSVQDAVTLCSQAQPSTATVIVNPMPTGSIAGSTTVCKDDVSPVVTFTGLSGTAEYSFTYTMNGGATQTIVTNGSNSVDLPVSTSIAGTYVYHLIGISDVTTLCGQTLDDTETIIVNPLPVATASPAVAVCQNDAEPLVTFTGATGTAPYSFTYNVNGGPDQFITTTSGNSSVSFNVPTNIVTTYNYTITEIVEGSALGCGQTQNVTTSVVVNPLPVVFAGNDISICETSTVILTGSGAGSGGTYTWNNGITNGIAFIPADTTTYTVIGTDVNGCKGSDQVTVNVVPFPTMDIVGHNLYGCAPVTSTFDNLSTGNLVNCTWTIGNGEVINDCGSVSVTFEDAGCYNVTLYASTPEGCSNTLTLTNFVCVEANPIADFNANPATLSTYNWISQMENESFGASTYIWDFGDTSPNSTETNPEHAFPNNTGGNYLIQLVAISSAGCVDTAWRTINLKDELIFYVPNTFTPDGDAFNESFKPIFTTGFDKYNYTLFIFNRWGELVFESHDTDFGWNGQYGVGGGSERCIDGTYTWKILVGLSSSGKTVEYNGHVNLLR